MMEVKYKLFDKDNKVLYDTKGWRACFSGLYMYEWNTMHLLVRTVEETEEYKDKWIELVKIIEPSIHNFCNGDEMWLNIPTRGSTGKNLLILTIIRYLWESSNKYHYIVPVTFEILEAHPDVDPLKAILIANSSLFFLEGFGHSLTKGMAGQLPGIWHYRRYENDNVHPFAHGDDWTKIPDFETCTTIEARQKDPYDWKPVWDHYKSLNLI